MALMPRESAKLIAELSKNVFIEEEGVKKLAYEVLEGLKNRTIHIDNFSQHELHPGPQNTSIAVDWIFVLDTLNFCFWTDEDDTKWRVQGYTGYFALCAAIKRALNENQSFCVPKLYSAIQKQGLANVLRGDDDTITVPLLDERVQCLREVGQVLCEKYGGSFENCIKACDKSAEKLLKLIVTEFECFKDESVYQGHRVSLYKRAQILVGDIWAYFRGKGLGQFNDIETITMFADYRVPQVLVHFGAMRYSNPLLDKLQSGTKLLPGSREEVEIRGCSIEVVELVRDEVKSLIRQYPNLALRESDCNAILIDHFLWDYRRQHVEELESIPFHKVRTIYY